MAYSSITKPSDYFNTVLYTGNGAVRTITTDLTSTDFIWNKRRDNTGNHMLYDVVRGINKDLNSDSSEAEETQVGTVTAFGSNSYTLGTHGGTNANGESRVSWNWSANGAGSSNTDGSITSTVSTNTTAGFSIVKYTGTGSNATVGHGLGATMDFAILRRYSQTSSWLVYHKSLGATKAIYLNETGAVGTNSSGFNNTEPTSSVFTIGNGATGNTSGADHIAYCFAEKKGYSKFGSYIGSGTADGTFVYTGFKPAFLLVKRTDSSTGGSWILYDNKRGNNVFNPTDVVMAASNNQSESDWGTNYDCDFLSNGIKWRYDGSAGYGNTSGATYIYMAFAENPLVANVSGGLPATAR